MTKRILCIGAFALALGAHVAYAAPVAKVNGADITDAELAFAEAEVGAEIAGLPPESRRRVLVEYLIEAHLFADEANKGQLTTGKDFEDRLAYYKLRAMRDAFYEKKVRGGVSEAQARAAYDEQIGKLKPEQEVHARHILVKTEDEAKDLVKQLKAGADFKELAKKSSDGAKRPFRRRSWLFRARADGQDLRGCRLRARNRARFPIRSSPSSAGM